MTTLLFLEASLGVGGAERISQGVLLGLDRSRWDIHVGTMQPRNVIGEEIAQAGIPVTQNLGDNRLSVFGTARSLRRYVEGIKPDMLMTSDSPLPMLWGGWLKRRKLVPHYCVVFHTTGFSDKGFRRRAAWRSAVPVADRVIATSAAHMEYVREAAGVPKEKLVSILNGVDVERFRPPADKAPLKEVLGYSPDLLLVGIVAALRPEKNHDMFLEAAARLSPRFPNARFLLVGDGPERGNVEQMVAAKGLGDVVHLLGRRTNVVNIMAALDVIVLSSKPVIETLPVCLCEGNAIGLPAVSTRVGSVAEIVDDGVTGFLVPSGDVDAFADRIGTLLQDSDLRRRFGQAARERAERLFDVRDMVRSYERLLFEVLGRTGEAHDCYENSA